MSNQLFRHIGGAIVSECGAITIQAAREICSLYQAQAAMEVRQNLADERRKALVGSLNHAIIEAATWRRAAGWTHPEEADYQQSL